MRHPGDNPPVPSCSKHKVRAQPLLLLNSLFYYKITLHPENRTDAPKGRALGKLLQGASPWGNQGQLE